MKTLFTFLFLPQILLAQTTRSERPIPSPAPEVERTNRGYRLLGRAVTPTPAVTEPSGLSIEPPPVDRHAGHTHPEVAPGFEDIDCGEEPSVFQRIPAALNSNPLIDIVQQTHSTNPSASFCTRSQELLDTIIIHHTAGPATDTASSINEFQKTRTTYNPRTRRQDPWYMIAYQFVVRSQYEGYTQPPVQPSVTTGRPMHLMGSHTGGDCAWLPLSGAQRRILNSTSNPFMCGQDGNPLRPDRSGSYVHGNYIRANVSGIGLVVAGAYEPHHPDNNPFGYKRGQRPFSVSDETVDMVARLACDMQRRNPRITRLMYHSQLTATSCPGHLKDKMGDIRARAQTYGCNFDLPVKQGGQRCMYYSR